MAEAKTLLIVRKPPYGLVDSWEVMRLALSLYAANLPVSVVFAGGGVSNWVSKMAPEAAKAQSVARFVKDLEQFEIPVYLVSEDLAERGLGEPDLASHHPKMVSRAAVAQLVASHDCVVAV